MTSDLCIFVPSYKFDIERAAVLAASIDKFNEDKIPVVFCVPQNDIQLFELKLKDFNCKVINEIDLCGNLLYGADVENKGYLNQQIRKLNCHLLKIAKSYLILDSDFIFCSSFKASDFSDKERFKLLYDDMQNFLYSDPKYFNKFAVGRENSLNGICEYFQLKREEVSFVFGSQIFHSEVLCELDKYLSKNKVTYIELISKFPYEYAWYNAFCYKYFSDKIKLIPNPFLMIHTRSQYVGYKFWGLSNEYISKNFKGILVNSKIGKNIFSPFNSRVGYKNNPFFLSFIARIIGRLI